MSSHAAIYALQDGLRRRVERQRYHRSLIEHGVLFLIAVAVSVVLVAL